MNKCPADARVLRMFEQNKHDQHLVAIPMVEDLRYGDRYIVRPHEMFDFLHSQCQYEWFLTKTFLFPKVSKLIEPTEISGYVKESQTLLISFTNVDDAILANLGIKSTVTLPNSWWHIFEGATYRQHSIYSEFETSVNGLVRASGEQLDICPNDSVQSFTRSEPMHMPRPYYGRKTGIWRTVVQLIEDTWCEPFLQ